MQVFISYSRQDSAFVERLTSGLKTHNIDVWLDTEDIVGSGVDRWRTSLVTGIRTSTCVVLVLSPNSVGSDNVVRELNVAAENRLRVIPVVHAPCELPDAFQYELAGLQHIDFSTQAHGTALETLVRQLGAADARPAPAAPTPAVTRRSVRWTKPATAASLGAVLAVGGVLALAQLGRSSGSGGPGTADVLVATASPSVPANTTATTGALPVPPASTSVASGQPFTAVATVHRQEFWTVWLQRPLPPRSQRPGSAADDGELQRFVDGLGAVDGETLLRVVLEGSPGHTSTIIGARARILNRRTPAPVASFRIGSQGVADTVGWFFNLDEPEPRASEMKAPDDIGGPFFTNRVITLATSEALTIDVIARTEACDCLWVLDLDAVVDGTKHVVTVDDAGEPFRTSSGQESVPHYVWAGWEQPPGLFQEEKNGTLVRIG